MSTVTGRVIFLVTDVPPERGYKALSKPAQGTLFTPPSVSLQSSFSSSVRALNSLKSVQCDMSSVQKSSRKITCRKMSEALSVHLGVSQGCRWPTPPPASYKRLPPCLTSWRAAIENTELHNFSTMVFLLYCDKRDSKITLMRARNCPTSAKT